MVFRVQATGLGVGQADLSINKFIEASKQAAGSDGRLYIGMTSNGFAAIDKAEAKDSIVFTASQIKKMAENFADITDDLSTKESADARKRELRLVVRESEKLGEHLTIGQKLVRLMGGRRRRARQLYKQVMAQEALVSENLRPANRMLNEVELGDEQAWLQQLGSGARHLAQMLIGKRLSPASFSDEQYAQVGLDLLRYGLPEELREAGASGLNPEVAREFYQDVRDCIEVYHRAIHGTGDLSELTEHGIDMVETLLARTMLKLQEHNYDRDFDLEARQLKEISERPRELPQSYLSSMLGRAVGQEDLTVGTFLREAQLAHDDAGKQLYITRRGFEALNAAELAQRVTPHRLTDEQVRELTRAYERLLGDGNLEAKNQLLTIDRDAAQVGAHLNPFQRLTALFSRHERSTAQMVHHIADHETEVQETLKELSDFYAAMSIDELMTRLQTDFRAVASQVRNLLDPQYATTEGDFRRAALGVLRATLPDGEVRDALRVYDDYRSERADMPAPSEQQMDLLGTMIARVGQGLRRERRARVDAQQEVRRVREADAERMAAEVQDTIEQAALAREQGVRIQGQGRQQAYEILREHHGEVLGELGALDEYENLLDLGEEEGYDSEEYQTARNTFALEVLLASIPEVESGDGPAPTRLSEEERVRARVGQTFNELSRAVKALVRRQSVEVPDGVHAELLREQIQATLSALDNLVSVDREVMAQVATPKPEAQEQDLGALRVLLGDNLPADPVSRTQEASVELIKQALQGVSFEGVEGPQRYYPMQSLLELYQLQVSTVERGLDDVTLEENCAKGLMEALYTATDDRFLQGTAVQADLQSAFTEYMRNGRNLDVCSEQTRQLLRPIIEELTTWILSLSEEQIRDYLVDTGV